MLDKPECTDCLRGLFGSNRLLVSIDFGPLGMEARSYSCIGLGVYCVDRGKEFGRSATVLREVAPARLWELILHLLRHRAEARAAEAAATDRETPPPPKSGE